MKLFCVISHTHWDREWYMPLESMKLRLCDLIDRCLVILDEQPEYIFHLDAQTVVLEDYLDIRPEMRDKLRQYISEERLMVGPWYLQNDYYLTSGESTVRNLLEGRRIAEAFGHCDTVGYAPDQFGNISQLPQILKGFGIDNFIFGRGLDTHRPNGSVMPSEFIWEGADGTQALAVHMRYWYNNAQHFPPEPDRAPIVLSSNERLFEGVALTPYLLLMNGVDHTEAQPDLLPILSMLNAELPEGKSVMQDRLCDYVQRVQTYVRENRVELPVHKGELRGGGDSVLKGTLSSRVYLKQANVRAQTMLENRLEPLYAMMELAGAFGVYSVDHFRYMWKQLMRNHPHDSICGCSRDEVHAHMEDNFARLSTTTADILDRGMKIAAAHLDLPGRTKDNYLIVLANTTQAPLADVVELTVDIPKADNARGITITDADGTPAAFTVLSKRDAVRDGFSPLNLPGNFPVDRYRISLRTGVVAPFAFKGFVVNGTAEENPIAAPAAASGSAVIENAYLRVEAEADGRIHLLDKRTGRRLTDALELEDTADQGDSYLYYVGAGEPLYGSDFPAEVALTRADALVQELTVTRRMALPVCYDFERRCRSEETKETVVCLTLRLTADATRVEIAARVDNASCDHRLRLLVNTGIDTDRIFADIPFDIVSHTDADHGETSSKVIPNSGFAVLEDGQGGVAVLTEGNHEVEHLGERRTLAFTLVRATGVITRDQQTLRVGGGDQWLCPQNQCLRTVTARFGLETYTGHAAAAGVPVHAVQFRAGLSALYTSGDERKFMQGRAAVQDSRLEGFYFLPDPYRDVKIPDNTTLLPLTAGDGVLVTALKKAENGSGLLLRAVNLTDTPQPLTVDADAWQSARMDETVCGAPESAVAAPKQIVTLYRPC